MGIAEYAIRNRVISWLFATILFVGGAISFSQLGQLEFPEFTIKSALVVTSYPGASPQQVEEEVTLQIEDAIQQLAYVDAITSINSAGLSQITVDIKSNYDKSELPQIWDELRRKVNDLVPNLPPGANEPLVVDDFGDVFGMLFVVTGAGYENSEINDYLDYLRRELVLVEGVKKVSIAGQVDEQVYIDISKERINQLGVSLESIFGLIENQNVVSNAGSVYTGTEDIRLHPTGEYEAVAQLEQLIISDSDGSIVYLGDIAEISRGYDDSPATLYRFNGAPAVSVGVAFATGVNVVDIGKAVEARLAELESERPVGIELNTVYNQSAVVEVSINDFLINLVEAVAIVIAVLLVFMGLRSGLLMGLILLLTILGTFIVMYISGIQLQKISLGALIIALGMLVDNAIVITEGMLISTASGLKKIDAAKRIVSQNIWPLLGATIIAVVAFAPIGLSPDGTGEFANSLFWVLLISLMLSWITAITLTPFFFDVLFKESKKAPNETSDHYDGLVFSLYKNFLKACLKQRALTTIVTVLALGGALYGFGSVKNVFFPPSTTPIYFVDYWLPQSYDIRATNEAVSELEEEVLAIPGVRQVTSVIGQGSQRFVLPYSPEKSYASYAQLIVETRSLDEMDTAIAESISLLKSQHPEAQYVIKNLESGPSPAAKIEARFSGPDPDVLRKIAGEAEAIFKADPYSDSVRHSWRNQTMVIRPEFLEAQARKAGIDKQALNDALLVHFTGKRVGVFRSGTDLLPIIIRSADNERNSPASIVDTQVWSPQIRAYVPISQVVSSFKTEWEDPLIVRRDRLRTISVYGEPIQLSGQTADSVFQRVKGQVEAIKLPDGYRLEWGGEYESSTDAQVGLFATLPIGLIGMFIITVFLFNTIKQPIIIWVTVPLSLIGIVSGLLILDAPFSFMALLGMLSLSGMLIKNGIVLVEQIKREGEQGSELYDALFNACVSRLRPVAMAAITTVLGMIPLLFDAFFYSMAVAIIFGLSFATVLTLIVLPVVYAMMYRIPHRA